MAAAPCTRLKQFVIDLRAARYVEQRAGAGRGQLEPDRVAGFGPEALFRGIFQVERDLAVDREGLGDDASARDLNRLVQRQRKPANHIGRKNAENAVLLKDRLDARGCIDAELLPLPKGKKPGNVVDVAICQNDGRDGRVA